MRIIYSATALDDLYAISQYLQGESLPAANRFVDRIARLELLLRDQPDAGRVTRRSGVRVIMMSDFPYQVFYRAIGPDRIRLLRVRHARRRPLPWT